MMTIRIDRMSMLFQPCLITYFSLFTELGHPRLDTRRVADPDTDSSAYIPAHKMLRQKATAAQKYHRFEGEKHTSLLFVYSV